MGKVFNSVKEVDLDTVRAFIQEAPNNYRQWWLHMYRESPYHVIVETVLIVILLYVLFFRTTKEAAGKGGKSTLDLSEKEIDELVADWKPEPLGEWDSNTEDESEEEELVLEKKIGNHVFIQGLEKKNAKSGEAKNSAISFGSYDFLGMSAREELREVTKMTLDNMDVAPVDLEDFMVQLIVMCFVSKNTQNLWRLMKVLHTLILHLLFPQLYLLSLNVETW